jgi:hypothetical protein
MGRFGDGSRFLLAAQQLAHIFFLNLSLPLLKSLPEHLELSPFPFLFAGDGDRPRFNIPIPAQQTLKGSLPPALTALP